MRELGEALEDAVEDHRRQGLRRGSGDAHVVDGAEVLLAAVEVGRDRQPVAEVAGIDQVAGAADVEHDRDACLARRRPHRIEADMARGVVRRAARGDEERGRPDVDGLRRQSPGDVEVGQRYVARRQQPRVDRAELDHSTVVCPRGADRELEIARVLPVAQAPIVEGVEDELAGEAEEVQGPRPILGDEGARRGEVLAVHDLGGLGRAVLRGGVALPQVVERGVEVAQLAFGLTGLPELVAARVAQRRDAVPDARVGVVAQPVRWLHDVGVGVVDDQPRRVVRHHQSVPPPTGRDLSRPGIWAGIVPPVATDPAQITVAGPPAIVRSPVAAQPVPWRRGRVA